MQQFLSIKRKQPAKRNVSERILDYQEITHKFSTMQARAQASRCEQCGNPGCEYQCPLGNYILDWVRLAAANRIVDAAQLSQATNKFPEICGRICPQDRLCEQNCILTHINEGAITIGSIEAWINDEALAQGYVYNPKPQTKKNIKVAVIGSGPAGLTCADELHLQGYDVTVFEQASHPGGLMLFGIPNFKLDKSLINNRIKLFEQKGIHFECQKTFGHDFSIKDLRDTGFKAVYLAFGAYKPKKLTIPGNDLPGIYDALPFLIQTNKMNLALDYQIAESVNLENKDVVVLGGGDTAMDCVRTSIRKKARSVTCLYRRDQQNMPGSQKEVMHAQEEGGIFKFLTDATSIIEHKNRLLINAVKMQLTAKDTSGRLQVSPTNITEQLKTDVVLTAFGFDVDTNAALKNKINVNKWGQVVVDDNDMTNVPGVFAGGDCVRGASLVVWAIKDGRDTAVHINNYLLNKPPLGDLKESKTQKPASSAKYHAQQE